MKNLKHKIGKIAENLDKVTAKDLIDYSMVINRIHIKNSIHFILKLNPTT